MGSSRFPGKVMLDLPWGSGVPLIKRIADQVGRSEVVSRFIVATSTDPADDLIAAFCESEGIECFRGSLADVYERYRQAALKYSLEHVVRLTGDN
ncbi:MAG: hypothetical protein EOO88_62190, partial [Pedobacter sp.]